jgi:hypothetical protein
MRTIILLLLLVITDSVYAQLYTDVYKCQSSSKQIVYQAGACASNAVNQKIVEIKKLDARQLEEAENKLKATEAERQALDKADQAAAAQQLREESVRRKSTMTRPVNQSYPKRMYYPHSRYHYRRERRYTTLPKSRASLKIR